MKSTARLNSSPADNSLVDGKLIDDHIVDDMELLADLLETSYRATYKGSSLKVRRRYRKLLVALAAAQQARRQAAYNARESEAVSGRSAWRQ